MLVKLNLLARLPKKSVALPKFEIGLRYRRTHGSLCFCPQRQPLRASIFSFTSVGPSPSMAYMSMNVSPISSINALIWIRPRSI